MDMRKTVLALCAAVAVPVATASAELLVGVTQQGFLIQFDSATPTDITSGVAVTGLAQNEILVGLDYRQTNNTVYGLGSFGQLYTMNLATGQATATSSSLGLTLNGSNFGFDWNPSSDLFRVISDTDQSLRVSVSGALVASDSAVAYAPGAEGGAEPNVTGVAYTRVANNATTLYGIDSGTDSLVNVNINTGAATGVGSLGLNINSRNGFDISMGSGVAFLGAMLEGESISRLYTVNTSTGATTFLGVIGGGIELRGLTTVPTPGTAALVGLGGLAMLRRRK